MKYFILLTLTFLLETSYAQHFNEEDSTNLKVFWESMNGPEWTAYNWNGLAGSWDGVEWKDGRVVSISLTRSDEKMIGRIPAEIGNLSHLKSITLSNINIEGTLPERFNDLDSLTSLIIRHSGRIDNSIDTIPDLSGMESLNTLKLQFYNLQLGGWPEWLRDMPALEKLTLNQVIIDQPFPSWITELRLKEFGFFQNGITGTVPDLSAMDIETLSIGMQDMEDQPFPSWVVGEEQLVSVGFIRLNLEGIPDARLFSLPNLRALQLGMNNLEGRLDSLIENKMTELTAFLISNNRFSGSLSPEMFDASTLRDLSVEGNTIDSVGNFSSFASAHVYKFNNNKIPFQQLEVMHDALMDITIFSSTDQQYGIPEEVVLLQGDTLELDAITRGSSDTYQWYYNDAFIEGATDSTLLLIGSEALAGSYHCKIYNTLLDADGTSAIIDVETDNTSSVLGLEVQEGISIYPNPSSDFIYIGDEIKEALIIDQAGKVVSIVSTRSKVDVRPLQSGIYFVVVGNESYPFIKL